MLQHCCVELSALCFLLQLKENLLLPSRQLHLHFVLLLPAFQTMAIEIITKLKWIAITKGKDAQSINQNAIVNFFAYRFFCLGSGRLLPLESFQGGLFNLPSFVLQREHKEAKPGNQIHKSIINEIGHPLAIIKAFSFDQASLPVLWLFNINRHGACFWLQFLSIFIGWLSFTS